MKNIRNFCIIAHIDHGKSTLADRLLELTHTVEKRDMRAQHLDTMDLEQERGITIKLQPARMEWNNYELNLIDTPGHADFAYEVSRSLKAVEGALLIIDATQGIEAQTLANVYAALEANLEIIPVINKIDLPAADVPRIKTEIENVLSIPREEVIEISAKEGTNCEQILDAVVERIPPPKNLEESEGTKALIFDSIFDPYRGVVIYVRNFAGEIKKGDRLKLLRADAEFEALEVGCFKPKYLPTEKIEAGEIGYIITGLKSVRDARVGETVWKKTQNSERKTQNKILLISGPGGSGKTTIAQLVSKKLGFQYLDGDKIDSQFFDIAGDEKEWQPENSEKLKSAHDAILSKTKEIFEGGKSVVVDYIIFGRYLEFIEKFKKEFKENLEIKILFPKKEIMIKRDKNRGCWTTGEKRISEVSTEFENLKSEIGAENFIDNSDETPKQTFEKHFQSPKSKVQSPTPLPGYKKVSPFVFAGVFANDANDFPELRDALEKLSLNDASLTYEPERSSALGFGFRVGFLGLLHLEIVQERLEREYNLDLIVTAPSVKYEMILNGGEMKPLANPSELPDVFEELHEPWVKLEIVTPKEYLGGVLELVTKRRGVQKNLSFLDANRALVEYEIPLASIITDFYDKLKNVSSGYASMSYEFLEFRTGNLVRLDVLVGGEKIDALSFIAHRSEARGVGMNLCKKLKDIIPRANFVIPIQAAIGAQIIARETLSAYRKDVTAKLYGGDVTRKNKLLKKQKAGKKRMKQFGKVSLPQEAFLAVLKRD